VLVRNHGCAFRVEVCLSSDIISALLRPRDVTRDAANSTETKRLAGESEQVKVRIESKAPTRIDLAGGTLDIWPLYLFHEGALTINCAITRYASCVIETDFSRAPSRGPAPGRKNPGALSSASRDTNRKESFPSLEALCRAQRYKLPLLAELVRCLPSNDGIHADD